MALQYDRLEKRYRYILTFKYNDWYTVEKRGVGTKAEIEEIKNDFVLIKEELSLYD